MLRHAAVLPVAAAAIFIGSPALAQRLPFERSFEFNQAATLDISTVRGRIDITAGDRGRILVAGTVTVRVSWDVPANALEIARRVASNPPVVREGNTLRLRVPTDPVERRAVTVSYQVQVPPETVVIAASESGATRVQGVTGAVTVRTQSAAIELNDLGGTAAVSTGSGAVVADGIAGALTVKTSSSAFTGRALRGDLRVHTSSGQVEAVLVGSGDVDVETGSSAVRLQGVSGGLSVVSESGAVLIEGVPRSPWNASTGSGRIDLGFKTAASLNLEAITRSGSISLVGLAVQGTVAKRRVIGTIGGGGPVVRVSSRSGSIRIDAR